MWAGDGIVEYTSLPGPSTSTAGPVFEKDVVRPRSSIAPTQKTWESSGERGLLQNSVTHSKNYLRQLPMN